MIVFHGNSQVDRNSGKQCPSTSHGSVLVLADEPTANLDSATAEEIISLMKGINKSMNTTFLFSTHDLLVQKYAQRITVLKDGLISSDERK
jgi:putative ABC transport system ATP-binding protein